MRFLLSLLGTFALMFGLVTGAAGAEQEKRIAFVIGNESYADGALPTAANDAGLIAQTLQAAGFDVTGARDLDAETLRQSYADFLKKVAAAGPDAVAFIYLSGYGLQYGNDNYYVPIGATVSRDSDIPIEAIRLSDLTGPLIAMNLKARLMVFDAAYKTPFKVSGNPLAGGFSIADAPPGSLIAYNSAPGTVAPVSKENYGLYAQSLAAMIREGGLPPDEIFDRVRLRVNEQSKGAEVPWDASKLDTAFRFFERAKDAPPPAATPEQTVALTQTPLKDLPVQQAYTAAVARDTVESYQQFTALYGGDPLAKRARVLLAARREAITWRRTISVDTPAAYWSYLSRYPKGPHAYDARLRLQALAAAEAPPEDYQAISYDVPPPPPDETVYVDQPVVYFADDAYDDYPPPPPPPPYWLPPVPVDFIDLPPPPPPFGLFFLPVPAFVPLPVYYAPPPYVVFSANNYFYGGGDPGVPYSARIHQALPAGGTGIRAGLAAGAVAAAVALPAAAAARTNVLQRNGITTPAQLRAARTQPGGLGALSRTGTGATPNSAAGAGTLNRNNALPGANGGKALPTGGATATPNESREQKAQDRQDRRRQDRLDRANAREQKAQDQNSPKQDRLQLGDKTDARQDRTGDRALKGQKGQDRKTPASDRAQQREQRLQQREDRAQQRQDRASERLQQRQERATSHAAEPHSAPQIREPRSAPQIREPGPSRGFGGSGFGGPPSAPHAPPSFGGGAPRVPSFGGGGPPRAPAFGGGGGGFHPPAAMPRAPAAAAPHAPGGHPGKPF